MISLNRKVVLANNVLQLQLLFFVISFLPTIMLAATTLTPEIIGKFFFSIVWMKFMCIKKMIASEIKRVYGRLRTNKIHTFQPFHKQIFSIFIYITCAMYVYVIQAKKNESIKWLQAIHKSNNSHIKGIFILKILLTKVIFSSHCSPSRITMFIQIFPFSIFFYVYLPFWWAYLYIIFNDFWQQYTFFLHFLIFLTLSQQRNVLNEWIHWKEKLNHDIQQQ